jgi:transcriptional regulator NrdR family protein
VKSTMKCTNCGGPTAIVKTYRFADHIRRRRKCLACGYRFNTREDYAASRRQNKKKGD